VACAILALCLLTTAGILAYTGTFQQIQSQVNATENSISNVAGQLSGGFKMLSGGLQLASGNGVAEIEANKGELFADTFTGNESVAVTCGTTPRDSYIRLINSGTANDTAVSVTIATGGVKSDYAIAGPCTIGPSGSATATQYVIFQGLNKLVGFLVPEVSQQYLATVTLADGTPVIFYGQFDQGMPLVSTTGVMLLARDFDQGQPANATCVTVPVPANMFVVLTNAGTAGASVASVTITWKNTINTFPISGSCSVGPDGTQSATTYIFFGLSNRLGVAAETGQPFTGTVTLSNGAHIEFSGSFQ
jgi:hypothetical protein